MPAVNQPQNGPIGTIAQVPIVFNNALVFGGAASQNTDILPAGGLPGLRAWFRVTGAAVAVSVQLQFANGQTIAGPNWQPLIGAFILDPTGVTPSPVNATLGSRFYRAVITAAGATTVAYRLAGTLT